MVPAHAHAQGGRKLDIQPQHDLLFGTVIAGVPARTPPVDGARAGQFALTGPNRSTVELVFSLPATMVSASGATMPLTFGASDAGVSATGAITDQVSFDPRLPYTTSLSKTGRLTVFLGGMVTPSASQRAGGYTATVTLTVAVTSL